MFGRVLTWRWQGKVQFLVPFLGCHLPHLYLAWCLSGLPFWVKSSDSRPPIFTNFQAFATFADVIFVFDKWTAEKYRKFLNIFDNNIDREDI